LENGEKARFLAKDDNLKTKAETDIALHHGKLVAGAGFEPATKQVASIGGFSNTSAVSAGMPMAYSIPLATHLMIYNFPSSTSQWSMTNQQISTLLNITLLFYVENICV
jgi:hypothetical protein